MHLLRVFLVLILAVFTARAEVYEPKAGTPERKAIMDAMRPAVQKQIGEPILFTGEVKISGAWAIFTGNVAPAGGKPAKKPDVQLELDLDYFALLQRVDGQWKVAHAGFAGDISVTEEAKKKFPKVPKELLPDAPQ